MSRFKTVRTTQDPRGANAERNIGEREVTRRVINAYGSGHQDATNQTVGLASSPGGEAALRALLNGDAKPYRAVMRKERSKIV